MTQAGLAIAEAIAGVTKPTVSIILGGAHSIGMPIGVYQIFEHLKKIEELEKFC